MFTFEGVEVGTPAHKRLFSRITDCLRHNMEVVYEEYLEKQFKPEKAKIRPDTGLPDDMVVTVHGMVWKCRGHVKP